MDDLLDLAKVEAGKIVVVPSEFTVASMFGALRGMLRPLLVGDAVALLFEEAAELPPLDTDEGKVSQILRNFISNALKFTERGEVRVWATADAAADTVSFRVRDLRYRHRARRYRPHLPGIRPGCAPIAVAREGHRPGPAIVEEAGGIARRKASRSRARLARARRSPSPCRDRIHKSWRRAAIRQGP